MSLSDVEGFYMSAFRHSSICGRIPPFAAGGFNMIPTVTIIAQGSIGAGVAWRLTPVLTAANHKSVYVECGAINPPTMLKVATMIGATGCAFAGRKEEIAVMDKSQ